MALYQKFGRLCLSSNVIFRFHVDLTNLSTTAALLYTAPTSAGVPLRLPSGYNAPNSFALFVKDQLAGQAGGVKKMKTLTVIWKNLSDVEKQHYVDSAKKVGDEKRESFEKLSDGQKTELIEQQANKTAKLRRLRKKKSLHKFYSDTNRPKQPLASFILFTKEHFEKQRSSLQTREDRVNYTKELGEQWRRMTELEKQPYVDQARNNLAAYHQQIEEWKQKHEQEIQEWRKTNEPKKKKTAIKGKAKKKLATTLDPKKVTKKKKVEEKGTKSANQKKGRSIAIVTPLAKNGTAEPTEPPKKKASSTSAKKVKKAEVKGAVD